MKSIFLPVILMCIGLVPIAGCQRGATDATNDVHEDADATTHRPVKLDAPEVVASEDGSGQSQDGSPSASPTTDEPQDGTTGQVTTVEGEILPGLKGKATGEDTYFVTEGFPYDKGFRLSMPFTVQVLEAPDRDTLRFSQVLVAESVDETGSYEATPANAAVNICWTFAKPGISFRAGEFLYTSLSEESMVYFKEDGVVVSGFKIAPHVEGSQQGPERDKSEAG